MSFWFHWTALSMRTNYTDDTLRKKPEKISSAKFNGRYYRKINNSLPFDFLGPPEETYSRLIAIRKFRLVNLMEILPTRSQQPGREVDGRVEGAGWGWLPPGVFIYRVCHLNLTASRGGEGLSFIGDSRSSES